MPAYFLYTSLLTSFLKISTKLCHSDLQLSKIQWVWYFFFICFVLLHIWGDYKFLEERSYFFALCIFHNDSEKATAPHSSTLAWKIPWMEEPGGLQSTGSLRVGHDWATSLSLFTFIGEGNGNPLQCSCLENPRDGGAWWAAVYGVAQSRTRLKRPSSSEWLAQSSSLLHV